MPVPYICAEEIYKQVDGLKHSQSSGRGGVRTRDSRASISPGRDPLTYGQDGKLYYSASGPHHHPSLWMGGDCLSGINNLSTAVGALELKLSVCEWGRYVDTHEMLFFLDTATLNE